MTQGQNGRDGRNGANGISVDLEKCGRHEADIINLQDSDKRQWEILDRVQNRLPNWATFTFSALTFILGSVITFCAATMEFKKHPSAANEVPTKIISKIENNLTKGM